MRNECDIVNDLLFSYHDGVLSKASTEFVDEHLKSCSECKKDLEEIREDCNLKEPKKEIDYLKGVKRKIYKKNILISISLILLIVIIFFNILVLKKYNEIASTMEIYLENNITKEETENIKNRILELTDNIELEYISKEKELEQMQSTLGDKALLINEYESKENPFMASYTIKTDINKIKNIVKNIEGMPGVKHINTHLDVNPYLLLIE